MIGTESQKVLGANSYVCRSYRVKTGRGTFLTPSPPSHSPAILNRVKAFTELYTRADATAQQQKKCSLKRRLRNIFTKIDAKPHSQNLANMLKNKLKQIEMKEAQVAKIRAKITWELEGEKCTKYFFLKLEKRKNVDQAILSLKCWQNGKILKNQQKILT